MRITKVKTSSNAQVLAKRNQEKGWLMAGNEELKEKQQITQFITNEKYHNLQLSLHNKIINKSIKDKEIQSELSAIFTALLDTLLNRKTNNNQIKHLKADKKNIPSYFTSRFRIWDNKQQPYIEEFYLAIQQSSSVTEIITKLPCFKKWLQKQLNQYHHTASSMIQNKIDVDLETTNSSSKRKQFLTTLLKDIIKPNTDIITALAEKLEELQQQYQLDALCTGWQEIDCYDKDKKENTKQTEEHFKKDIHRSLKNYLQKHHQPRIFGQGSRDKLSSNHLANRDNAGLYVYHNEVVNYLENAFPLKSTTNKTTFDNKKDLLTKAHIAKVIQYKIHNKIIQQLIQNGKILHDQETAPTDINSEKLQQIKIVETTQRKLSDAIIFAFNKLREQIIVHPEIDKAEQADIDLIKQEDWSGSKKQEYSTSIENILNSTNRQTEVPLVLAQYQALYLLRNAVFHVQKIKLAPSNNQLNPIEQLIKLDINNSKRAWITKLQSTNILAYYSQDKLAEIFKEPLSFGAETVAFAPAFKKVLKRADGLKYAWAKRAITKLNDRKNYAYAYLLELVYYHYFLAAFLGSDDQALFKQAVKEVKSKNKKGYLQIKEIPDDKDPQSYLAAIQSEEQISLQKKASQDNKKTSDVAYFQRYLQDIFAEGFTQFITDDKRHLLSLIEKQETSPIPEYLSTHISENHDNTVKEFSDIITFQHAIKTADLCFEASTAEDRKKYCNAIKCWYGLFSLLDMPHLNMVKGTLLKYQQAQKRVNSLPKTLFEADSNNLITLISLKMLTYEAKPEWRLSQKEQLKLLSMFIDFNPKDSIQGLQEFEPKSSRPQGERQQLYLSGEEVILTKTLNRIQHYNSLPLFSRLSHEQPKKIKVSLSECQKFYQQESGIERYIKEKNKLREEWIKDKTSFSTKQSKQYKQYVYQEQTYIHAKNKINLFEIEKANALLQDIWAQWISLIYLWERDLFYIALALLNVHGKLGDKKVEDQRKKDSSKISFIDKLCKDNNYQPIMQQLKALIDCGKKASWQKKNNIRNAIVHYHHLRGINKNKNSPPKSLLDHLTDMRNLLNHDRKLKNAVSQTFIKLFDRYGMNIEFKSLHQNNDYLQILSIKPKKICHLGDIKIEQKGRETAIETALVSDYFCHMIQALLELKIEEK